MASDTHPRNCLRVGYFISPCECKITTDYEAQLLIGFGITVQPNEVIRTRNRSKTLKWWHRRLAGARENTLFTAQAGRLCHHEPLHRYHLAEVLQKKNVAS